MIHLWNGILLGLSLSVLIGPILFTQLQTSLEQGTKAGLWVCLGTWISDVIFIFGLLYGITSIVQITESSYFEPLMGILGGFILIGIGVGMFISKPNFGKEDVPFELISSKWQLCLKGFSINTFSPFTVFFWTSAVTSKAIELSNVASKQMYVFLVGILSAIMFTDMLKVFLAKQIRHNLKPIHIARTRKISGIILFLFGIGMMVMGVFF